MEWSTIIMLAIAILVILFPLAFIWFVCIGGICMAVKKSRVAMSNLKCSVDTDCPSGFICVDGHCVPHKA